MASKVVIVTGASRGIGLAVAEYLIQASHKIVLVSRSEQALRAIRAKAPGQVEYVTADLSDLENAKTVIKIAITSFGRLDGLVVNHGALLPLQRIENANLEQWKRLYDANLFSALALVKEALPHLRASRGNIVFTSSGAAVHAYTSWGAYGSSKAAMNALAQHIAEEEPSITTVAIGPGRVDTNMQKEVRDLGKASMKKHDLETFVSDYKEGRLNKPEWPGEVIARLSLGANHCLSGKFLSWKAAELAEYRTS